MIKTFALFFVVINAALRLGLRLARSRNQMRPLVGMTYGPTRAEMHAGYAKPQP